MDERSTTPRRPGDILSGFGGATDLLSSEGLIIPSRGHINFFHESFFDYVYARTFSRRPESLVSLLTTSEQHLFRRTQVRQIVETLRQADRTRYHQELFSILTTSNIRHHIKVALAQWLSTLSDPTSDELNVILRLDPKSGSLPQLVRISLLGSIGWFDRLYDAGWLSENLKSATRTNALLYWLSDVASQRPKQVAAILDGWWDDDRERGQQLLNWFSYIRNGTPDDSLRSLCCRVIRANQPQRFREQQDSNRDLIFHVWVQEGAGGASEVLRAYFDAWFEANPTQHPFDREELRGLDTHALAELAKKSPTEFLKEPSMRSFAQLMLSQLKLKLNTTTHLRAEASLGST